MTQHDAVSVPEAVTITIDAIGLATLQDSGRGRYADLGVPTSGAWDVRAYSALCAVAGVEVGRWPVMEAWSGDLAWHASAPLAFVVSGPAEVTIAGRASGRSLTVVLAPADADVRIRRTGVGPVMVLVPGLRTDAVLGSVAYDSFARLGTPPLRAGQEFVIDRTIQHGVTVRVGSFVRVPDAAVAPSMLDAVIHPGLGAYLLERAWTVVDIARSGVRLRASDGDALGHQLSWASGPVCPGVIQVPGDGNPILLGPDAGTTGGYPIAGVLTERSRCAVAYAAPGHVVRFRAVPPPVIDVERASIVRV